MFDGLYPSVATFKSSIPLVGGLISFYAYRASRRTNRPFPGTFTVGFGLVAIGSLLNCVVDRVLLLSRNVVLIVDSGFTVCGLVVQVYSLVSQ